MEYTFKNVFIYDVSTIEAGILEIGGEYSAKWTGSSQKAEFYYFSGTVKLFGEKIQNPNNWKLYSFSSIMPVDINY